MNLDYNGAGEPRWTTADGADVELATVEPAHLAHIVNRSMRLADAIEFRRALQLLNSFPLEVPDEFTDDPTGGMETPWAWLWSTPWMEAAQALLIGHGYRDVVEWWQGFADDDRPTTVRGEWQARKQAARHLYDAAKGVIEARRAGPLGRVTPLHPRLHRQVTGAMHGYTDAGL